MLEEPDMLDVPAQIRVVTSEELIADLEERHAALAQTDALLVFDGDGTLWSGDVGNDVFDLATRTGRFRESLRGRLSAEAALHGLELDLDLPTPVLATEFIHACRAGQYPERDLCALQAWCYVGFTEDELRLLTREALGATFEDRYQAEVRRVVAWTRSKGLRPVVVSASPRVLVEVAAAGLGFTRDDVVAVEVQTDVRGELQDDIDGEVPYGEHKVTLARKRYGAAPWLAAFGDNGFDAPMLAAAERGVAVRAKQALVHRLPELTNTVHLRPDA